MRRMPVAVLAVAMAAAGLTGCGSSSGNAVSKTPGGAAASPSLRGSITVFAAASLTESFTALGRQFQAIHPGVKVTFSFAASSALATQITNGAPVDVFASASGKNMDQAVAAGAAAKPTTFAKNVAEVAVPPSNPGNVTSVTDLARSSVKVALCQPQVPCGSTARKVFTNAKITVRPVTLEPDVKSVLSKVTLGEVDAGVVYVTDVRAAGSKVRGVQIPANLNASTSYPIAVLIRSANSAVAQAFVAHVLSPAGQSVLTAAGFERP